MKKVTIKKNSDRFFLAVFSLAALLFPRDARSEGRRNTDVQVESSGTGIFSSVNSTSPDNASNSSGSSDTFGLSEDGGPMVNRHF